MCGLLFLLSKVILQLGISYANIAGCTLQSSVLRALNASTIKSGKSDLSCVPVKSDLDDLRGGKT